MRSALVLLWIAMRACAQPAARFATAEQTVYHDAQHASYILLPRIPEE